MGFCILRCVELGVVPAKVIAFLATVESDPAVSGAKASFDSSIAAIQSAWNVAVAD